MSRSKLLFAIMCVCVMSTAAWAAGPAGLLAEWNCDEGRGDVLHDSSGNGNHGKIRGAAWVECEDGFALEFNGMGGYVDFSDAPSLQLAGAVTMEAWIRTLAYGWKESPILSTGGRGYELMYSTRGLCWWSVGRRQYAVGGKPELGQWSYVVATFDGKRRSLWINGRLTASQPSPEAPGQVGSFMIGSVGQPIFRGMVSRVRLYNRAISQAELFASYREGAPSFGFDPAWFQRLKVTPFYYFDRGEVVLEMDYRGLRPLEGKAEIEVTLSRQNAEATTIDRCVIAVPELSEEAVFGWGNDPGWVEASLPCADLAAGRYVISATLRDGKGQRPAERVSFDYPPKVPLPSPAEKTIGRLPPAPGPVPFDLQMAKGGGFGLLMKGTRYPFETRISWPNGDFNRLTASDEAAGGEKSWKAAVKAVGKDRYEVEAGGSFYTVHRQIEVFPTHVYVKDTFTNTTDSDLGLLIYDETPVRDEQLMDCRLSGYEGGGRQDEQPGYRGSSVFLADGDRGLGMVPMDDVFMIHSVVYAQDGIAGMGTERFALAAGASYTLEWAVYPTGSGEYYDFINAFRKVEDRIGTVEGALGCISFGGLNRRQVPDRDFIEKRGIKVGIIHGLGRLADDPGLADQGFAFIDFPKEQEMLHRQAIAIKRRHPGLKVVFHNAHTLYATNNPERFADSKIVGPNGRQKRSGGLGSFSQERLDEGWAFWVFYPTPGNLFHDAMMRSVDVMMDEMDMDGSFVDGFLLGYGGRWTYDGRWDGHSSEIDPKTKTIQRRVGSVLLLMQPSMIEYARKIHDKGGVVIANGAMMTRGVADENYILFDSECQAGPECHLAPTVLALGNGAAHRSEKDIYRDVLDKLRWGVLYMHYNERIPLRYPSLAARQFPMTFEEIRSGLVRGPERIVTMNSGVYGWPGDRKLHLVHKYDERGAEAPHDCVTTVDRDGVRTELEFARDESAVIEPIPVSLEATAPINVRVLRYDGTALRLLLNGHGDATLDAFVGTDYPDWRDGVFTNGGVSPVDVGVGAPYRVTVGGATTTIVEKDGSLLVPMNLDGQVEVSIERADGGEQRLR